MNVAVVTGASSGIGAELAYRLGQRGWRVVIAATESKAGLVSSAALPLRLRHHTYSCCKRREAELRVVASKLPPGRSHVVVADVSKRADVERVSAEAISAFGGYCCWVNNAGVGINKSTARFGFALLSRRWRRECYWSDLLDSDSRTQLELTEEEVDNILAANTKAPLFGMQVAVAHFKTRTPPSGRVVNISSFLGRVPAAPFRSIYSAAKAALNSLTSNVRMDLAAAGLSGIHAITIMPGVVHTPFSTNALHSSGPLSSSVPGQSVEEAVTPIVEAIEAQQPPSEVYTQGSRQHAAAVKYVEDVGAFEQGFVMK